MRVPQTFVPEKDLTGKVKEYMDMDDLSKRIIQLHEDPNLGYVAPSMIIASGITNQCRLTLTDVLETGMGEKVLMFDKFLSRGIKPKKIPPGEILRIIQKFVEISETQSRKCMYAGDFLEVSEDLLFGYIDPKNLNDTKKAYLERIKVDIADACFEEPSAIKKGVMDYFQMARAMLHSGMEHGDVWEYKDPQTQALKSITLKGRYVFAVEERLGHNTEKQKEEFRKVIDTIYSKRVIKNPGYDLMDNPGLVGAVIDVKLESDMLGGSLVGALASRTNEENQQFYNKIINNMIKHSSYCKSCAGKTIEYFCAYKG